jgi:DNA repair photolyase
MNNLIDTNTTTTNNVNSNVNINNDVNNIYFFLDEKEDAGENENVDNLNEINEEILKMLDDFKFENYDEYTYKDMGYNDMDMDMDMDKFTSNEELYCELDYFINKKCYCNDEIYYNTEHNIKDLIEICKYYGIDKFMKLTKCKKQDIIVAIITFEMDFDNYSLVQKRHKMWAFMTELKNDPKMKKYLLMK